ncbi:hypothetical protein E2C01_019348 [Portunus trituberculatus]|uniref:Uncharacterized protein n=1 Tax=Portunus trituberculatus TaxID=210409 RepID=A0A5B7E060_PORTR|nr:hypothetical protein [Portunus trituberculatus]
MIWSHTSRDLSTRSSRALCTNFARLGSLRASSFMNSEYSVEELPSFSRASGFSICSARASRRFRCSVRQSSLHGSLAKECQDTVHCGKVWHKDVHTFLEVCCISEYTTYPQVHKAAHDKLSDTCEDHMGEEIHKFPHTTQHSSNTEFDASSVDCKVDKAHQDGTDEWLSGGTPGACCKGCHRQGVWFHKALVGRSQKHHSGRSAPQNWSASI